MTDQLLDSVKVHNSEEAHSEFKSWVGNLALIFLLANSFFGLVAYDVNFGANLIHFPAVTYGQLPSDAVIIYRWFYFVNDGYMFFALGLNAVAVLALIVARFHSSHRRMWLSMAFILLVLETIMFVITYGVLKSHYSDNRALSVVEAFVGYYPECPTVVAFLMRMTWFMALGLNVYLFFKTPKSKVRQGAAVLENEFKKCQFCAEEIRAEAVKCKHCGSDIS